MEDLFRFKHGYYEQSNYSDNDLKIIDTYYPRAIMETFKDVNYNPKTDIAIDIRKAHTNILLNNEEPYMIFNKAKHNFTKFNVNDEIYPGLYLMNDFMFMDKIPISKQLSTAYQIRYLLANGMKKDNIEAYIRPYKIIDPTEFKKFVEYILELVGGNMDNPLFKSGINNFIGCEFGKRFYTKETVAVTNHYETFCELYHYYRMKDNTEFTTSQVGEYFYCRLAINKRENSDDFPIYIQIVNSCQTALLEIAKKAIMNGGDIIYAKTDCIGVRGLNNDFTQTEEFDKLYKVDKWAPLQYHTGNIRVNCEYTLNDNSFEWIDNDIDFSDDGKCLNLNEVKSKNCLVIGGPGFGKTNLLKQIYQSYKDGECIVFSANNKALAECKRFCENAYTFNRYNFIFHNNLAKTIKCVLIDEIYTAKTKWISYIANLQMKYPNVIFLAFGDVNQCKAIQSYINYDNSLFFASLFNNNRITLKYVEKTARYDNKLKQILDDLLSKGTIPNNSFKPINKKLDINICYFNNTVDRINTEKMGTSDYYNNYKVGHRIISEANDLSKGIIKNQTYEIVKLNPSNKHEALLLTQDEKHNYTQTVNKGLYINLFNFKPFFACTVFKIQGTTINEDFNIWDIERMNLNELNVAISRGHKISQIHMNNTNNLYSRYGESTECITFTPPAIDKYSVKIEDDKAYIAKNDDKNDNVLFIKYHDDSYEAMEKNKNQDKTIKQIAEEYKRMGYETYLNKNKFYDAPIKPNLKAQLGDYQKKMEDKIKIYDSGNKLRIRVVINGVKLEYAKLYRNLEKREEAMKFMNEKKQEIIKEHIELTDEKKEKGEPKEIIDDFFKVKF